MEPSEIFRDNVYRIIKARKLVQAHIAEQIGEKPQSFNDYLKGRIGWGETKRKKLAKHLNVDYHQLYDKSFLSSAAAGLGFGVEAGAEIIRKGQVDPSQLKEILEAVDAYLAKAGKSLDMDKKSRLVALLYDRFAETDEQASQEKIRHYLKLIA